MGPVARQGRSLAPPRRRTGRRDCRSLACGRRWRAWPSATATGPSRTSRRRRGRSSATRLDGIRGPSKWSCARADIMPRPCAAFQLAALRWPRTDSVDGTPDGVLRARRGAGLSDHRDFWHSAAGHGRSHDGLKSLKLQGFGGALASAAALASKRMCLRSSGGVSTPGLSP